VSPYVTFLFGLVAAFVVAPAIILFQGVYDYVTESVVRSEEAHFVERLSANPYCRDALRARTSTAEPLCHALGLGDALRVRPDEIARSRGWLLWPGVLDRAPPLLESHDDHSSRGYRKLLGAGGSAERMPSALVEDEEALGELVEPVPAFVGRPWDRAMAFALVVLFAAATLVAVFVVHRSVRRLYLTDVEEPPSPPAGDELSPESEAVRRITGQLLYDGHVAPHPDNARTALELVQARDAASRFGITLDPLGIDPARRETLSRSEFEKMDGREDASPWRLVRAPLTTIVTGLMVLLGIGTPALDNKAAIAAPLAVALPLILRALGFGAELSGVTTGARAPAPAASPADAEEKT
jgi:hypothetical protein